MQHILRIFLAASIYCDPASHIFPFWGASSSSSLNRAAEANMAKSNSGVTSCVGSGRGDEYVDDVERGDAIFESESFLDDETS